VIEMEVSASGALVAVEIALMLSAVAAVYFTRRRLSPVTEADFAALDDIERQRVSLLSEIEERKQKNLLTVFESIKPAPVKKAQRATQHTPPPRRTMSMDQPVSHFVEVHHIEGIATVSLEPDPKSGGFHTIEEAFAAFTEQDKER